MSRCLPTIAFLCALALTGYGASVAAAPGVAATPPATSTTSSTTTSSSSTSSSAPSTCTATYDTTMRNVASRIYGQTISGPDADEAVARVERSVSLARAVAEGNATQATAILRSLELGEIVEAQIERHGAVLAKVGSTPSLGAAKGTLTYEGKVAGTFSLTVTSMDAYLRVVSGVTSADILIRSAQAQLDGSVPGPATLPSTGPVTYNGATYQVVSIAGVAFPSTPVHLSLLIPSTPTAACTPGSATMIAASALGLAGERIYQDEGSGVAVTTARTQIATFPAFAAAVASASPSATRAAIIKLFQAHLHVVRVRAYTAAGKLITDVGGPHVLAPSTGYVQQAGHTVGRFVFAIQDDAGYSKLILRFTGAFTVLRQNGALIASDANIPAAKIPSTGPLAYGGHTYYAFSFNGVAFPSGTLQITLLVPVTATSVGA